MKQVINDLHGSLIGRAWNTSPLEKINFSNAEVSAWVNISIVDNKEVIKVRYRIVPICFSDKILFETDSFIEVQKWISEHIDELEEAF